MSGSEAQINQGPAKTQFLLKITIFAQQIHIFSWIMSMKASFSGPNEQRAKPGFLIFGEWKKIHVFHSAGCIWLWASTQDLSLSLYFNKLQKEESKNIYIL